MKIGVIQASSQIERNQILYDLVCKSAKQDEVINFGCFEDEREAYSYIDISIEIGLLLASKSIDFVVTGCSSGQGMMLACNNMPSVICGYTPTPQDAYLFGRINDGNAISLPLGLNYGWAGEINLKHTLSALFVEPFGIGYPPQDAQRKIADTSLIKHINTLSKKTLIDLLNSLDDELLNKSLNRKNVVDYILTNSNEQDILQWINRRI